MSVNDTTKTGIFLAAGLLMATASFLIVRPSTTDVEQDGLEALRNQPLFKDFTDPLAATELKIVSFDADNGKPVTFEVRKNPSSKVWTIPSRADYPADAVNQMKTAANGLIDLTVLDIPTDNAGDHKEMGVIDPTEDSVKTADSSVGKLVTFKDEKRDTIASLIIGKPVKDQPGQLYVRKPGQSPVYVVALDEATITSNFQAWIEADLLQLSSIDVQQIRSDNYSFSVTVNGNRYAKNQTAVLEKDGADWKLLSLKRYDPANPNQPPTQPKFDPEKVNATTITELVDALDDLKFVDVKRKPEGLSADLKADSDLANNKEAQASLFTRGFFPTKNADGDFKIVSANGELSATTVDGVKYTLYFGNISGLTTQPEEGDEAAASEAAQEGVNRYLMVTTSVDDSFFPAPALQPIPQTLEEWEKAQAAAAAAAAGPSLPPGMIIESQEAEGTEEPATEEPATEKPAEENTSESKPQPPAADDKDKPADPKVDADQPAAEGEAPATESAEETAADADNKSDAAAVETSGSGQETVVGQAFQEDEALVELTDEEKAEKLAVIQEQIQKANARLLEERKDRMATAQLKSQQLNQRFADWYYEIPESTYSKLRLTRDNLFEGANAVQPPLGPVRPGFQPPGGFGPLPGLGN